MATLFDKKPPDEKYPRNEENLADQDVDLADDRQEEILDDIDLSATDPEVSDDEVLYGTDDDDFDPEYYDNEDEYQTYDQQEIKYHDDM